MHLYMYTSDYTGNISDIPQDFSHILVKARLHNPTQGITGVLFFDNGKFIQVLEGEKEKLDELVAMIKKDHRHTNFKEVFNLPIQKQELAEWNMRAFNFSSETSKNWDLLDQLRDAYLDNFKISSVQIITWLKRFIEDYDRFKRLEQ